MKIFVYVLAAVLAIGFFVIKSGAISDVSGKYKKITPDEAKKIMDSGISHIVLDVRTLQEFNSGHIKGAVLIPHNELEKKAEKELPDKNILILVYCRSGSRSKVASHTLLRLGYNNVLDFGGINDWKYDIEKITN